MNYRIYRLLALLLLSTPAVAAEPSLRWCAWDFPGFIHFDATSKLAQGPYVDFMNELTRRAGYELIISEQTPPARCVRNVIEGTTDLVVGVIKMGEGRPEIEYIPFGSRWPDKVYLSTADNRRVELVSELSLMTLVSIRNYTFHERVQPIVNAMPPEKHIRVGSVHAALEIIAKQWADAALLPAEQVTAVLKQYPELSDKIREVSFPISIIEQQLVNIGLSTYCNCPEAAVAIKHAIFSMQQDGTTQRIFGEQIIIDF